MGTMMGFSWGGARFWWPSKWRLKFLPPIQHSPYFVIILFNASSEQAFVWHFYWFQFFVVVCRDNCACSVASNDFCFIKQQLKISTETFPGRVRALSKETGGTFIKYLSQQEGIQVLRNISHMGRLKLMSLVCLWPKENTSQIHLLDPSQFGTPGLFPVTEALYTSC